MAVREHAPSRVRLHVDWSRKIYVDLGVVRLAGAFMLIAGVILPHIPGYPGVPCPLRTATGIPCPLCGMTTSVRSAVRGDVMGSLAANPGGLVAVLAAIALLVLRPKRAAIPLYVIPLVLGSMWLFELARFDIIP